MNKERKRAKINLNRSALKAIVVLAVAFCLIATLTRFLKGQHIDALKHDMDLSALVVTMGFFAQPPKRSNSKS